MTSQHRTIAKPLHRIEDATIGVFLGVFGDYWVENAIESLERQDCGPLPVVVAINGPCPPAWDRLSAWQKTTRHSVTIVSNERNLGPLGSWYLNKDLLRTPWISLFHQDDVYLPHHISTHEAVLRTAEDDVLAVFTGMQGVDLQGRPAAAPPMINEHLNLAPTRVSLPEIIRRHPLPTPSIMIRNPRGVVDDLAWYDSGAPDSEWFARLACRGRFRVLDKVTMRYRISPGSESQSTGWYSRAWQWAQSVDRLIQSDDFNHALAEVPPEARTSFAVDLLDAISARYPASPIFGFLSFAAAQRMATAWQYEPGPATDLLVTYLAADPDSAATRNLAGITGVSSPDPSQPANDTVRVLLGEPPIRGRLEQSGRAAYRRFGHLLPPTVRMLAYRLYDRLWARRGAG